MNGRGAVVNKTTAPFFLACLKVKKAPFKGCGGFPLDAPDGLLRPSPNGGSGRFKPKTACAARFIDARKRLVDVDRF